MQIVTDSAADLTSEQLQELQVHVAPLVINLDGKSYQSGIDLQPGSLPTFIASLRKRTRIFYPYTFHPA